MFIGYLYLQSGISVPLKLSVRKHRSVFLKMSNYCFNSSGNQSFKSKDVFMNLAGDSKVFLPPLHSAVNPGGKVFPIVLILSLHYLSSLSHQGHQPLSSSNNNKVSQVDRYVLLSSSLTSPPHVCIFLLRSSYLSHAGDRTQ